MRLQSQDNTRTPLDFPLCSVTDGDICGITSVHYILFIRNTLVATNRDNHYYQEKSQVFFNSPCFNHYIHIILSSIVFFFGFKESNS